MSRATDLIKKINLLEAKTEQKYFVKITTKVGFAFPKKEVAYVCGKRDESGKIYALDIFPCILDSMVPITKKEWEEHCDHIMRDPKYRDAKFSFMKAPSNPGEEYIIVNFRPTYMFTIENLKKSLKDAKLKPVEYIKHTPSKLSRYYDNHVKYEIRFLSSDKQAVESWFDNLHQEEVKLGYQR